ncbi:hypothetical protein ACFYY2_26880 [Streptomyces sp. NPDC001822]|uniref:hypothetical protein n=1 Tax=Streptomyces sp. NPDC001822 TaxID=3364614 RepID=UPI00368E99C2
MYELSRGSLGTSSLLRYGRFLVVFTSTGDGTVGAEREEPKSGKRMVPHDAAVGCALAATHRDGGQC